MSDTTDNNQRIPLTEEQKNAANEQAVKLLKEWLDKGGEIRNKKEFDILDKHLITPALDDLSKNPDKTKIDEAKKLLMLKIDRLRKSMDKAKSAATRVRIKSDLENTRQTVTELNTLEESMAIADQPETNQEPNNSESEKPIRKKHKKRNKKQELQVQSAQPEEKPEKNIANTTDVAQQTGAGQPQIVPQTSAGQDAPQTNIAGAGQDSLNMEDLLNGLFPEKKEIKKTTTSTLTEEEKKQLNNFMNLLQEQQQTDPKQNTDQKITQTDEFGEYLTQLKEETERKQKEEEEKRQKEEEERIKQEEQERIKREEVERKQREEQEKKQREEENKETDKKPDAALAKESSQDNDQDKTNQTIITNDTSSQNIQNNNESGERNKPFNENPKLPDPQPTGITKTKGTEEKPKEGNQDVKGATTTGATTDAEQDEKGAADATQNPQPKEPEKTLQTNAAGQPKPWQTPEDLYKSQTASYAQDFVQRKEEILTQEEKQIIEQTIDILKGGKAGDSEIFNELIGDTEAIKQLMRNAVNQIFNNVRLTDEEISKTEKTIKENSDKFIDTFKVNMFGNSLTEQDKEELKIELNNTCKEIEEQKKQEIAARQSNAEDIVHYKYELDNESIKEAVSEVTDLFTQNSRNAENSHLKKIEDIEDIKSVMKSAMKNIFDEEKQKNNGNPLTKEQLDDILTQVRIETNYISDLFDGKKIKGEDVTNALYDAYGKQLEIEHAKQLQERVHEAVDQHKVAKAEAIRRRKEEQERRQKEEAENKQQVQPQIPSREDAVVEIEKPEQPQPTNTTSNPQPTEQTQAPAQQQQQPANPQPTPEQQKLDMTKVDLFTALTMAVDKKLDEENKDILSKTINNLLQNQTEINNTQARIGKIKDTVQDNKLIFNISQLLLNTENSYKNSMVQGHPTIAKNARKIIDTISGIFNRHSNKLAKEEKPQPTQPQPAPEPEKQQPAQSAQQSQNVDLKALQASSKDFQKDSKEFKSKIEKLKEGGDFEKTLMSLAEEGKYNEIQTAINEHINKIKEDNKLDIEAYQAPAAIIALNKDGEKLEREANKIIEKTTKKLDNLKKTTIPNLKIKDLKNQENKDLQDETRKEIEEKFIKPIEDIFTTLKNNGLSDKTLQENLAKKIKEVRDYAEEKRREKGRLHNTINILINDDKWANEKHIKNFGEKEEIAHNAHREALRILNIAETIQTATNRKEAHNLLDTNKSIEDINNDKKATKNALKALERIKNLNEINELAGTLGAKQEKLIEKQLIEKQKENQSPEDKFVPGLVKKLTQNQWDDDIEESLRLREQFAQLDDGTQKTLLKAALQTIFAEKEGEKNHYREQLLLNVPTKLIKDNEGQNKKDIDETIGLIVDKFIEKKSNKYKQRVIDSYSTTNNQDVRREGIIADMTIAACLVMKDQTRKGLIETNFEEKVENFEKMYGFTYLYSGGIAQCRKLWEKHLKEMKQSE